MKILCIKIKHKLHYDNTLSKYNKYRCKTFKLLNA
uniref:Uncharacterized protein n=1 Tax=Myoviridae sp. ctkfK18 TaxID=2825165 RepID=A0A8S5VGV2_9CAUD|nr:MAG TPA: hypothetical protein [Myoviridae sp. ctkfK18]